MYEASMLERPHGYGWVERREGRRREERREVGVREPEELQLFECSKP